MNASLHRGVQLSETIEAEIAKESQESAQQPEAQGLPEEAVYCAFLSGRMIITKGHRFTRRSF
jgi:hypothetical protein